MSVDLTCTHCGNEFTTIGLARLTRCPACQNLTRGDMPRDMPSGHRILLAVDLDRQRSAHYRAREAWDSGAIDTAISIERTTQ